MKYSRPSSKLSFSRHFHQLSPPLTDDQDDENSDRCYACGDGGELLLCDGCPAAYHYQCADPPLHKHDLKRIDNWYCPPCSVRRAREEQEEKEREKERQGIMAPLMGNLAAKLYAFKLPPQIREYFEDVATGPDGEYVDASPRPPHLRSMLVGTFSFCALILPSVP